MYSFEELEKDNPNLKALDLILAAWDEGVDTGVAARIGVAMLVAV